MADKKKDRRHMILMLLRSGQVQLDIIDLVIDHFDQAIQEAKERERVEMVIKIEQMFLGNVQ